MAQIYDTTFDGSRAGSSVRIARPDYGEVVRTLRTQAASNTSPMLEALKAVKESSKSIADMANAEAKTQATKYALLTPEQKLETAATDLGYAGKDWQNNKDMLSEVQARQAQQESDILGKISDPKSVLQLRTLQDSVEDRKYQEQERQQIEKDKKALSALYSVSGDTNKIDKSLLEGVSPDVLYKGEQYKQAAEDRQRIVGTRKAEDTYNEALGEKQYIPDSINQAFRAGGSDAERMLGRLTTFTPEEQKYLNKTYAELEQLKDKDKVAASVLSRLNEQSNLADRWVADSRFKESTPEQYRRAYNEVINAGYTPTKEMVEDKLKMDAAEREAQKNVLNAATKNLTSKREALDKLKLDAAKYASGKSSKGTDGKSTVYDNAQALEEIKALVSPFGTKGFGLTDASAVEEEYKRMLKEGFSPDTALKVIKNSLDIGIGAFSGSALDPEMYKENREKALKQGSGYKLQNDRYAKLLSDRANRLETEIRQSEAELRAARVSPEVARDISRREALYSGFDSGYKVPRYGGGKTEPEPKTGSEGKTEPKPDKTVRREVLTANKVADIKKEIDRYKNPWFGAGMTSPAIKRLIDEKYGEGTYDRYSK